MHRSVVWIGLMVGVAMGAHAATPVVCVPVKVKVQGNNLQLMGPERPAVAELYLIQNVGQQGVWIDHPTGRTSMSAGWSSYIRAGRWSGIVLNRKDFLMTCAVIQPGKVNYQNCVRAVHVCVPKGYHFKVPPKNTYWIVEDKMWDEAVNVIRKRGVEV